jgi:putative ABC transport system permease protein
MYLPLANILHYKLRSVLSSLGIGIGIAMLVTLSGFARGTLGEIGDRWETVDADLIVLPRGWGENVLTLNGPVLSDRFAPQIAQRPGIARVVPVFLTPVQFAGQDQVVAGVDPSQWHTLTGGRTMAQGTLFDRDGAVSDWLYQRLSAPADDNAEPLDLSGELAERGGMEIVIDTRLATKGRYKVGDTITAAAHQWRVAGIVPSGAMARVFMPRRTAQYIFGLGGVGKSTLMFVKLAPGADAEAAAADIRRVSPALEVIRLRQYRQMLMQKFGIMYRYVDAVNAISLVIAFLFIMVTLYMMVLQRTRDIAILKSCGASSTFILRQVMAESLILTGAGFIVGVGMSLLAARLVEALLPLYTVTITWQWVGIAAGVAACGAAAAALYPAWRATRVDMAQALTLE